jgi:hypothetical protein
VVLLDDDVVPQTGLLDAYLAAMDREPGASAYVGLTQLPPPATWVQRAVVASRLCYFYGIADRTSRPPWGVTANICVRGRTNNSVAFDPRFPRTGGGEDVDFCIRLQSRGYGPMVAVPAARVTHPFWTDPLSQVWGWASGDVLCLYVCLPQRFRTPNSAVDTVTRCPPIASGRRPTGPRLRWSRCSSAPRPQSHSPSLLRSPLCFLATCCTPSPRTPPLDFSLRSWLRCRPCCKKLCESEASCGAGG